MAVDLLTWAVADYERAVGRCSACGGVADSFLCNATVQRLRPEAHSWDWWVACRNEHCAHHYGQGYFQDLPPWIMSP